MAVEDFKNIDTRTGLRLLGKDLEIIQRGMRESNFGKGKEDIIEFTIYDASDNQLPQGESGELTRHISINIQNINEYFLSKDAGDGVEEYFIDVEKLLKEAGYNLGLFKVQFQLLNNRVGRHNTEKLYIHEIAPSRTEVRLVPVTKADGTVEDELFRRYDGFAKGKGFRDDVIYHIDEFLESIKVEDIVRSFINKHSKEYQLQILKEFKLTSIEQLMIRVTKTVKEAINHYVKGNYYDPTDQINYGKPRTEAEVDEIFLDINELLANILRIACDVIDLYLPKRNIQDETYTTMILDPSVDVREIIKDLKGDTTFESVETESTESYEEEDFEEDVEDIEDEILNEDTSDPQSFLTVSPGQLSTGIKQGGRVQLNVNSSSPVTVTVEFESGGTDWIKSKQSTLATGNQTYEFAYQQVKDLVRDLPIPIDIEEWNAGGGPRTPSPYATPEEIGNLGNQPAAYLQAAVNPYNTGRFTQNIGTQQNIGFDANAYLESMSQRGRQMGANIQLGGPPNL